MNRFYALALPCIAIAPTLAVAENIHLPGHRAVYELSLGDTRGSVAIRGAEGRYVFDLEDICEGYTLNERLVVRLARDGGTVLTDYRLSAFETENGDLYRFSTETEFNGTTEQSASGNLSVAKESAEVDYDAADDVTFDEAVMPPLAHIRAILDAARAGEDRYAATVFDGDIKKPVFYAVTRITDAEEDVDLSKIEGKEALEEVAKWRIDSVYFPPTGDEDAATATPEFRFTATLFENGVVTDLILDYLDFSLEAELVDLKVHESGC
jgi:hypothetical protein